MPIRFLNTTGVENFFVADAAADRVGIGTTSPKQLLHLMKGGITASFTAPESEMLRVQSKAPSELSGNPPASDINIFTDGTGGGYSRVIFTDDQVPYGENGLYYDHTNRYFSIVNKGAAVATATASRGFYCGENHTIGTNDYAFAANDGNVPSGGRAFAAGHLTTASGDISAAFGYDTLASGGASFSIGALTTASGGNSFASGGGSTASGGESAAFGFETTASGEESFAIGNQTTASGASSFAGGGPTTLAGAPNAFAFGADVDVTGGHSAGFGRLHDIAGTENLVGGLNNVVNGAANLVGGANNNLGSKTNNLVAGGSNTFGSNAGNYNTVIGFSNECNGGSYSFIGGQDAFNFGSRSISFGSGTTASTGNQQFAFGEGTTTPTSGTSAYGSNQFVVGKFNIYNTVGRVHLFAVGNGSSNFSRFNAFNVDTLGRVGLGVSSPSYQLQLNTNSAAKPTSSTWTVISDERVKTNIQDYTTGLSEILQINPKTFDYNGKAGFDKTTGNIGIIAQEVKDIMPETISTYEAKLNEEDTEEIELFNFDAHPIQFALINAVKELNEKIKSLEQKIENLK